MKKCVNMLIVVLVLSMTFVLTGCPFREQEDAKPVIYLYPTEPTVVLVELRYNGVLDFAYPEYNNGWEVTAYPDGTLVNHFDNREYSYLFWEGRS